jgi:hypothetical protein
VRSGTDYFNQVILERLGKIEGKQDAVLEAQGEISTAQAVSTEDRKVLHEDLVEVKDTLKRWESHSHPAISEELSKVTVAVFGRDGVGGLFNRLSRVEWIIAATLALATLFAAPLVLEVMGGIGYIFWLIVTGHIKVP